MIPDQNRQQGMGGKNKLAILYTKLSYAEKSRKSIQRGLQQNEKNGRERKGKDICESGRTTYVLIQARGKTQRKILTHTFLDEGGKRDGSERHPRTTDGYIFLRGTELKGLGKEKSVKIKILLGEEGESQKKGGWGRTGGFFG